MYRYKHRLRINLHLIRALQSNQYNISKVFIQNTQYENTFYLGDFIGLIYGDFKVPISLIIQLANGQSFAFLLPPQML